MDLLRKWSKGRFPLPLSTAPKDLYQVEQRKKTGLPDAHWVVWRNSGEPPRECSVADRWCGQGSFWVENNFFFKYFRPLRYSTTTLMTWKNATKVSLLFLLSLLGVTMLLRSCAEGLIVEFAEKIYRENRLLGLIFVPGFVVLYWRHNYQLLETCCSETAFVNQGLAFVDFWDDKNFFVLSIMFEVRIVTLNLRCYLMVVFCLRSTDSGTSSLAFPTHLVSVVVKRLITFASLELNS